MIGRPFIIFSVERHNMSEQANRHNTAYAESLLIDEDLDYLPVQGMYLGVPENSFIVFSQDAFDMIRGIAKEFDQESILMADENGESELVYLTDGHTEPIGRFTEMPENADLTRFVAYSVINEKVYTCQ